LRTILCLVVVIISTIVAAQATDGAETVVVPYLGLSEEYSDNIFLVPKNTNADYITHVTPGIQADYASPRWDWQLNYSYDHREYAKYVYANDNVQQVFLRSTARIVKDLLYFYAGDDAGRTSISSVQDYTKESPVRYQTNYNTMELRPYAVLPLTSRTTLTTGYQYRNIWYDDPRAIDKIEHSPYGDLSLILSEKTALNASVRYDRIEIALGTKTRMSSLFGPRYDYGDGSSLWCRIGPSRTTYVNNSAETHLLWDAGFFHSLSSTMTMSYETGRSWIEDPYLVERREDRLVASLRTQKERTAASLSFAIRYYGTVRNYTDERKYTTTADFSHYLMERLQAYYAVAINRYEHYPATAPDSMTIVWQTDVRFDYHTTEKSLIFLRYQYTDSYSAQSYSDNYGVNSLLVGVKWLF
jgi:hypothetical protein